MSTNLVVRQSYSVQVRQPDGALEKAGALLPPGGAQSAAACMYRVACAVEQNIEPQSPLISSLQDKVTSASTC